MTSVRVFAIVAIVGVLVLGISACRPGRGPAKLLDECVHDAQCLEGLFCCDDTCHECCEDYDCDEDAGERCSDEHRCVKVGEPPPPAVAPAPLGADCERVRCQEGLHCCDDAKCHECCYPIHCDKGEDCQGYKCVPWENYPFPPPAGSLGSGCDTDPDCQEGLHCCDDAKCHKCCYDPHCAQNEDCVDYWCVPVPKPESEPAFEDEDQTATEPESEQEAEIEYGRILDYAWAFNDAFERGDPNALSETWHPLVKKRYLGQCQDYAGTVIGTHVRVEVVSFTPLQVPWMYRTDGVSDAVDQVIRVTVLRTVQGETGETTETIIIHLAPDDDGHLKGFTDCGVVVPAAEPEEPAPPPPAPPPEAEEPAPPPVLTETKLIGSVPKDMGVGVHVFDHTIYAFSGPFDGTGCGSPFSEAVPMVCDKYVEVANGEVGADRAFSLTAPLGPTFLWYATRVDQDGIVIELLIGQVDTTGTTKQETPVEIEWRYCIDF